MLKVNLHTDNAAFEDLRGESARILRAIADKIEAGHDGTHYQTIFDINGNDVGRWKFVRGGFMTTRKVTVFKLCSQHASLSGEGRYRMAEFFCEGGPIYGPCDGEGCKIRPGTDLFTSEVCSERDWFTMTKPNPFGIWDINRKEAS